jgi:hypothetical protein
MSPCRFKVISVDGPTYQLARYLTVEQSSNQGKYTDCELDRLFERQKRGGSEAALSCVSSCGACTLAEVATHRCHKCQG